MSKYDRIKSAACDVLSLYWSKVEPVSISSEYLLEMATNAYKHERWFHQAMSDEMINPPAPEYVIDEAMLQELKMIVDVDKEYKQNRINPANLISPEV